MIDTSEDINIGEVRSGLFTPDSIVIGSIAFLAEPTQYLFVQNDSANSEGSPYHVSRIDETHYEMPNAIAPRLAQYIGVFVRNIGDDTNISRLDNTAVWTIDNEAMIKFGSVTASGQAIIDIQTAGTANLSVTWKGLTSYLTITAVEGTYTDEDEE